MTSWVLKVLRNVVLSTLGQVKIYILTSYAESLKGSCYLVLVVGVHPLWIFSCLACRSMAAAQGPASSVLLT